MEAPTLRTVEMHTGGEPVRIVVDGLPRIPGATILDKRRYAARHLDQVRRMLMHEPRGHADMYGVIPVEPDHPEADLAVLFMHNEGFSTMCGHATIAIGRWAVESGLVPAAEPATTFGLQVPAGLVRVIVEIEDGVIGRTRFHSVPSFVAAGAVKLEVPDFGEVEVDLAFGGAFYAFVDAARLGLRLPGSPIDDLVDAAWAVTGAAGSLPLHHPGSPDLEFVYGTILTDGADDWSPDPTVNLCVFADRQVDRSPTGSGVSARIAIQHAAGLIGLGQERTFESIVGSRFTGMAVATTEVGGVPAVVVEVGGRAHRTGEAVFFLEADDPLPHFLVR